MAVLPPCPVFAVGVLADTSKRKPEFRMEHYLQMLVNGLSTGAVYAVIAIGFALIFNVLKFSNFSHGGVMVVSAYIGFFFTRFIGSNLLLTILLAALGGGLLNIVVELVGFRMLRRSNKQVVLYFVSSVTIGMLLENFIALTYSGTFYSYPNFFPVRFLNYGEVSIDVADIMMLIIATVAISILILIIYKTRFGIRLRALSLDARTTSLMGVNVNLIVMVTFFVAGVFAAIAGVFVGVRTILSPQMGSYAVKGFVVCVIGGLGNISGALFAAIFLGIAETVFINYIGSALAPVGIFLAMLVFLTMRPEGLAGKFAADKA
jgi:branched-chain amino acid transport system permease protein